MKVETWHTRYEKKIKEEDKSKNKSKKLISGRVNKYQGNVFVKDRPVCDRSWSVEDAELVCRVLKFKPIMTKAFAWTGKMILDSLTGMHM